MLNFRIVIFLLSIPLCAASQSTWLRSYGGNGQDFLVDMEVSDELIHQSGYFTGFTNFQGNASTSNGGSDIVVLTTDLQGQIVSFTSFGGGGNDRATDVEATSDGGILVAGLFREDIEIEGQTFSAIDSSDAFVAKLNGNHELQWFSKAGGIRNEQINQAIELNDGSILVTGEFKGVCTFGNVMVESALFEGSLNHSTDGFIAMLDENGEWMWVKTFSSAGNAKGLALAQSTTNQIYAAGEFSRDLTFDETHSHGMSNAGMLFELNATGDEIWFAKFTSGSSSVKSLSTQQNGNILAAVGAVGAITFFGQTTETISSEYNNTANLFQLSSNGALLNQSAVTSANTVIPIRIHCDPSGKIFLAGEFRCSLSEYADEFGTAIFNSLGYNDVFLTAFDENLNELWKRHVGGNRGDVLGNIASLPDETVLMNGTFDRNIHFSAGPDLITYPENFNWPLNWLGNEVFPPNYSQTICEIEGYGNWLSLFIESSTNAFLGSVFNPDQPVLDYFKRDSDEEICTTDIVEPFMSFEPNPFYTDYLEICDNGCLALNTGLDSTGYYSPIFDLTLSSNFIQQPTEYCPGNSVEESGEYWYTLSRADGCVAYGDTIELVVFNSPEQAVITNVEGVGQPTSSGYAVALCGDMTLHFDADYSDCQDCTGYWLSTSNDEQLTTTSEAFDTFLLTNDFGCSSETILGVDVDEPITLTPVEDPTVLFSFEGEEQGGVWYICSDSPVVGFSPDWIESTSEYFTSSNWTAKKDGEVYWTETVTAGWNNIIPMAGTGLYEFEIVLVENVANNCSNEEFVHAPLIYEFYIEIEENQPLFTIEQTPLVPCVGDTVFLEVNGVDNWFFTNQSTTFYQQTDSTGYVLGSGNVGFIGFGDGEGCLSSQTTIHNIQYQQIPVIEVYPFDFLCEGETVTLSTSPEVDSYEWIGAGNDALSNSSQLEINEEGSYYCELILNGCSMSTIPVNIQEFIAPEITLETTSILCENESIFLTVETPFPEYFHWNEPLSGNAYFQEVTSAGEYSITSTGCGEELISIEIVDALSVEVTAEDTTFCFGESVPVTGAPGFDIYNWNTGDETPEINVDSTQWVVLVAYDEYGCESVDSVFVSQIEVTSPNYTSTETCLGEDALISSDSEGSIIWTSDAEGTDIVGEGPEFVCVNCGLPSNLYIAVYENSCLSIPLLVEPEYFPSSFPPIIFGEDTICSGGNLFLFVENIEGVQYEWNTPIGTIEGPQVEVVGTTGAHVGAYTVLGYDENCQSNPSIISVVVNGSEPLAITGDDSLCEGSTLNLSVTNLTNDIENYVWVTPSGTVETEFLTINDVSATNVGSYSIEIITAECEYIVEPLSVSISSLPVVEFGFDCFGEQSAAFVNEGFESYSWSNGSSTSTALYQGETLLSVSVTDAAGCEVFTNVIAPEMDCVDAYPNIISPNLDGTNDVVNFDLYNVQFQEVIIFNRWGEAVRTLNTPDLKWDGTDDEENPLSESIYYWVGSGLYGQRNGIITLVR